MFGLHRPGWAFLFSGVVLAVAIMCCRAFFLLSRSAGLLQAPFAFWAGFLACLNYAIWTLNQGGFSQLFG
jgi:tryptophan-rich sensory protein